MVKQTLNIRLNKETGYSNSEHMTLDLMLRFESSHWNDSLIAMQHLTHCQGRVGGLCHWKIFLKSSFSHWEVEQTPHRLMQYWCILSRPCRSVATSKKGYKHAILWAVLQWLQFLPISSCCKFYLWNCDFYNFAKICPLLFFFAFYALINIFLLLLCLNSVTH